MLLTKTEDEWEEQMRRLLTILVLGLFCISGYALAAQNGTSEDFMQMHLIESAWHQAATTKNVDLIMSLFADDATFLAHGKTIKGKVQLRQFWQHSDAFQPQSQLVGYTPSFRLKYDLEGDKGHLYFECLYVDSGTNKIVSHVGVTADLTRENGHWLIADAKATPLTQL